MTSRVVKYWHKTTETAYEPLGCTREEANWFAERWELAWCPDCKAYVAPDGALDADGVYDICPFCGTHIKD